MTSVYGDIKPEDDYTHPLGPEKNFNDSMYFNFFDTKKNTGGFLRIGNRANERYAEVTLCLYLPTGEILFNYRRPEIDNNDAFDAGGMKFETLEALTKHRTTYEGTAVFLTDPSQMADPSNAFRNNPHKPVSIELTHEAAGPVYGSSGAGRETQDPEKDFAKAHYEQHMRVTGHVTVDGDRVEIDGFGLRDHSWGPRYWQNIQSYRWLNCTFGPDLGIMVTEIRPTADSRTQGGVVVRGETMQAITSVDIDSNFDGDSPVHTGMKATLVLDNGETITLEGTVKSFIPLRNRREGKVTHIGEGMTEYRLFDRTALGISEYLDQIE
jgi:hypothetical protein